MGPESPLERIWAHLVRTPPTADGNIDPRGRFLAALLLVFLLPLVLVGMLTLPFLLAPDAPTDTNVFGAAVSMVPIVLASYFLNRSGHLQAATLFFAIGGALNLTYASLDHPRTLVMFTVLLAMTFGLFPLRGAVLFNVAAIGLSHATVLVLSQVHPARVLFPLAVNGFNLVIGIVVQRHQQELARARREELERRENWFSTTLRCIGDAVLTVDLDRRITFMNPVAELLTGTRSSDARGQPLDAVFTIEHEDTGEPVENPVDQVLRDGTVVGLANHTVLVARDGSKRPIADSGAPIVDGDGVTYGVVLVFRDVSDDRTREQELQQSQRLNALGRLAGGVAHDFTITSAGRWVAAASLVMLIEDVLEARIAPGRAAASKS